MGIVVLLLILVFLPVAIGCLPASYVDKKNSSIAFMWVSGLLLMWAGFQFICVPLILTEGAGEEHFPYVVWSFPIYLVILTIVGGFCYFRRGGKLSTRRIAVLQEQNKWERF